MTIVTTTPQVTMRVGVVSDTGPHRKLNEDSVLAKAPVFAVADGMGGHEAGEVASAAVVDVLSRLVGEPVADVETVQHCLAEAQVKVAAIETTKGREAGTTVSGAVVVEQDGAPYWLVVNLGDSRTYRMNHGDMEQISVDHSEVQELIEAGQLTAGEAMHHPRRNVVTRALGGGGTFAPDYWLLPMVENDRLMVCSDGLTSELSNDQIRQLLLEYPDPTAAAQALVDAAIAAGGRDNVSVIVVDVSDVPAPELGDHLHDTNPIPLDDEDTTPVADLS